MKVTDIGLRGYMLQQWRNFVPYPVAARGCLPPGKNVCVAAPANQIGSRYSYGYNDDVGVECDEHYAKLGV